MYSDVMYSETIRQKLFFRVKSETAEKHPPGT